VSSPARRTRVVCCAMTASSSSAPSSSRRSSSSPRSRLRWAPREPAPGQTRARIGRRASAAGAAPPARAGRPCGNAEAGDTARPHQGPPGGAPARQAAARGAGAARQRGGRGSPPQPAGRVRTGGGRGVGQDDQVAQEREHQLHRVGVRRARAARRVALQRLRHQRHDHRQRVARQERLLHGRHVLHLPRRRARVRPAHDGRASGSSLSCALRVCTSLTAALLRGTAKLGWRRTGSV